MAVSISRPVTQSEIRIAGLDVSVHVDEIAAALAKAGDCKLADIQMGAICRTPNGMNGCWARCPEKAAYKLKTAGR